MEDKLWKAISYLMAMSVVLSIISLICYGIYSSMLEYESYNDTAIVVRKEFKESYVTTTHIRVRKVRVPRRRYHPEKYNVIVSYEGENYTIDDKSLFESAIIGENVNVTVSKGYNAKGELKKIHLTS